MLPFGPANEVRVDARCRGVNSRPQSRKAYKEICARMEAPVAYRSADCESLEPMRAAGRDMASGPRVRSSLFG